MIALFDEDWGIGDYYPEPDKYGWRDFEYTERELRGERGDKGSDDKSLWDKFWGN